MSFGIIYSATNTVNGKQYVGQTKFTLSRRWQRHIYYSKFGSMYAIHRAIRKYGVDAFQVEQIDDAVNLDELNEKETYHIFRLNTIVPNGYNLTTGGGVFKFSEETRQKMSDRTLSTEVRRKISKSNTGRVLSSETRRKMSKSATGRRLSPETRQKLSKAISGSKTSLETRRKMSESATGHTVPPETRKKLSESVKLAWKIRDQEIRVNLGLSPMSTQGHPLRSDCIP